MTLFKDTYRIETTRLKGYDYSRPGAYFITICTYNRECLFGKIIDGNMILNETGEIVNKCIIDLPNHYQNLKIDKYIIMPDHIHCIMIIIDNAVKAENYVVNAEDYVVETGNDCVETGNDCVETGNDCVETGLRPVSTQSSITFPKNHHGISEFVRALKSFSSRRINEMRKTKYPPIWQSRFYDRIIRDEFELNNIRNYILNNPKKWGNKG